MTQPTITHRIDSAGDRFDPITLEVIRHRLDKIAEEMQATLLKSSCSPIVKEGLDASASDLPPLSLETGPAARFNMPRSMTCEASTSPRKGTFGSSGVPNSAPKAICKSFR